MTERSYNGWEASPTLKTRTITPIPGVSFRIRDNSNVAAVFTYLVQQFDARVERVKGPVQDDWGYAYRQNRNADNLSCHASGTAIDLNALRHPNGRPADYRFTPAQIATIHAILHELEGVVRWGGDYTHTVDAMHFEINVLPGHLRTIGAKLRANAIKPTAKAPTRPSVDQQAAANITKGRPIAKVARPKVRMRMRQIVRRLLHGTEPK